MQSDGEVSLADARCPQEVVYRHTGSGSQGLVKLPGYSGCSGPWIDQPLPSGSEKKQKRPQG